MVRATEAEQQTRKNKTKERKDLVYDVYLVRKNLSENPSAKRPIQPNAADEEDHSYKTEDRDKSNPNHTPSPKPAQSRVLNRGTSSAPTRASSSEPRSAAEKK